MILPFTTQLKGKPTFFPDKIIESLLEYNNFDWYFNVFNTYFLNNIQKYIDHGIFTDGIERTPKIHTLRTDSKNKWFIGCKIHFMIHEYTENQFQFAPEAVCTGIQKIKIKCSYRNSPAPCEGPQGYISVKIDGRYLSAMEVIQLSKNDGFDLIEDFFHYFYPKFEGKIIHWTSFKY